MENVRRYHNDVKRHLIQRATQQGDRVLDVGCGCGGDIGKWKAVNANLDACDPDEASLEEAMRRAEGLKMKTHFFKGDILSCPKKQYDVICYNFSLHYIFKTQSIFFATIKAIQERLKPGGKLIGCIPDSESILMSTPFKDSFGNIFLRSGTSGFGNFGEKIFVSLVDTPFYKDGPKPEPIAYKDLLITHLENIGFRLERWCPLMEFPVSQLYSEFIFVRS